MSSTPKRSRQKRPSSISFKAYAARNCAKVSARLPFLTKQQIRAKLLDSWRRRGCRQEEGSNSKSSSKSRKRSQETKSVDPSDNPDNEEKSDSNLKQGNEVQDTGVVSGLFKSRSKEITETSPKLMEASATRLLPSEESEGSSNFHAMFSDQDAIFL